MKLIVNAATGGEEEVAAAGMTIVVAVVVAEARRECPHRVLRRQDTQAEALLRTSAGLRSGAGAPTAHQEYQHQARHRRCTQAEAPPRTSVRRCSGEAARARRWPRRRVPRRVRRREGTQAQPLSVELRARAGLHRATTSARLLERLRVLALPSTLTCARVVAAWQLAEIACSTLG